LHDGRGGNVETVTADLYDAASLQSLVNHVAAEKRHTKHLVNVAASAGNGVSPGSRRIDAVDSNYVK